jgi:hypothetical protein
MLRKPAQNGEKFKRKVNGLRSVEKPVVIANTTAYKDLKNANYVNSLKESQTGGLKSSTPQKNLLQELHNSSNRMVIVLQSDFLIYNIYIFFFDRKRNHEIKRRNR